MCPAHRTRFRLHIGRHQARRLRFSVAKSPGNSSRCKTRSVHNIRLRGLAAEGRTLTALIEEGLRLILVGKPKGKAKRVLPPVSDAKGGPWPGIDITDGSALQEMDDLEYVERMKHFK